MVTITGGKLTTWRRMAKMAVDRLVEREARDAPCRTHEIPLGQAIEAERAAARRGRARGGLRAAGRALRPRRPRRAGDRRASAASWPSRSSTGRPDLLAEVVHAARREQARTVGDVLLRRTRLGLVAARDVAAPDGEVARRVAAAMAPELGWDGAAQEAAAAAFADEAARRGHRPRLTAGATTVGRAP